jgi:hypothetical protein
MKRPDWEGGYKGAVILLGLISFSLLIFALMIGPNSIASALGVYAVAALPVWLLADRNYFAAAGVLELISSALVGMIIFPDGDEAKFVTLCIFLFPSLLLGIAGILLGKGRKNENR